MTTDPYPRNDLPERTTMAPMGSHEKRLPEGTVAAWLGLIVAGGTTVTFNIWHDTHTIRPWGLGIVAGITPVALAMIVSHLVATYSEGNVLRGVTFAVMVGAMILSVGATGAVVHPATRSLWWLFGAVIDTAALACLQVLLSLRVRAARQERERAEAEAQAADERAALRAELEAGREAIEMERAGALARAAADQDAHEVQLAAQREALEAERAAREAAEAERAEAVAKAEITARKLEAVTARKRRAATGRKQARATARKSEPVTGSATAPAEAPDETAPDDLDSEAKVLWYLDQGYSASKAGIYAGLTDGRGRQIARLRKSAPTDTVDGGQQPDSTEEPS